MDWHNWSRRRRLYGARRNFVNSCSRRANRSSKSSEMIDAVSSSTPPLNGSSAFRSFLYRSYNVSRIGRCRTAKSFLCQVVPNQFLSINKDQFGDRLELRCSPRFGRCSFDLFRDTELVKLWRQQPYKFAARNIMELKSAQPNLLNGPQRARNFGVFRPWHCASRRRSCALSDAETGQETRLSAGRPIRVGCLDYHATAGRKATTVALRSSAIARTCSAHSANARRFSHK